MMTWGNVKFRTLPTRLVVSPSVPIDSMTLYNAHIAELLAQSTFLRELLLFS